MNGLGREQPTWAVLTSGPKLIGGPRISKSKELSLINFADRGLLYPFGENCSFNGSPSVVKTDFSPKQTPEAGIIKAVTS